MLFKHSAIIISNTGRTIMIEMYLLEQLVAVAKHKTLLAAADALHITQPALTRSMKKLEQLFGFALFDHHANRIEINENGLLASEYAKRILQLEQEMIDQVTHLEQSKHTIFLESCAPAPMIYLQQRLALLFSTYSVQSHLTNSEGKIIEALKQNKCQLAIVSAPVKDPNIISAKIFTENLYLSVMPAHPASQKEKISFQKIDGETFLLHGSLGIWKDVVNKKLSHSRFIVQDQMQDLSVLLASSSLPAFTTNISWNIYPRQEKRLEIPIVDPEASITFYLAYHRKDQDIFKALLPET